jgi:hypothetical protein
LKLGKAGMAAPEVFSAVAKTGRHRNIKVVTRIAAVMKGVEVENFCMGFSWRFQRD